MATRVAINGFGRIGRAVFRAAHERELELEFVAINDLAPSDQLEYLLRHDSVYGRFGAEVERDADELAVDGHELAILHEPDPIRLPWSELDVDVVLECTGRFRTAKTRRSTSSRAPEGRRVGADEGSRRDRRARRQLRRGVRPRLPRRHLECLVHDQLPRAGRQGAARERGHQARPDDDHSRVHRGPAARRPPPQGLSPGARRGGQPDPDHDRRRQGDRPRDPGARRQAARLCRARAGADGLARRPDGRGEPGDLHGRAERAVPVAVGGRRAPGDSRLQRRGARLVATSSALRTRRSSTRR